MHIGAPDEDSFVADGTPLLGFIDILGLAPKFLAIYSIIEAESYSESAITAQGFKLKLFFTKSSCGIITLVPLTFAARVISARGSSDSQSFIIWFGYPQKNSTLVLP